MESLVSTEWLAKELGASDLRVVDATCFLPEDGRDAAQEYEQGHIPGALFMDLGNLVDSNNPLPSMLPPAEKFASRMQTLGLGDGSRIVLYDACPLRTAARAWWMLTVFGAHNVAILDGGLTKWKLENRPLANGKEAQRHRHFTVWKDETLVRTKDQMLANLDSAAEQVVDARSPARFAGLEPEPRPGVQPGHLPGSRNLPANDVFVAPAGDDDHVWLAPDALKTKFDEAGVDLSRPIVTTCGSGITACVIAFAAQRAGANKIAVYDGSWAEWGADPATPKETGKPR